MEVRKQISSPCSHNCNATGTYIHTDTSVCDYTSAVKPLTARQTYLKLMKTADEEGKNLQLLAAAHSSAIIG